MPAIGKHKTKTVDQAWDGPASEARLKNDGGAAYYLKAYAWVDPNKDPETKAAYKFIHHEVDGEGNIGAANLVACSAAIAVLNGGRGGANVPSGDRSGIWSHVAAHIQDGGKEAPELKRGLEEIPPTPLNQGGTNEGIAPASLEQGGRTEGPKLEERTIPAGEIRIAGTGADRRISGYAALFNSLSEDLGGFREQIREGAFAETIKDGDIRFVLNHNPDFVFGRTKAGTLILREDKRGLWFENVPPDAQWAKDRLVNLERGDIDQMSFRFRVLKEEWDEEEEIRTLVKVDLRDITLATFPAYPQTEAHVRSMIKRSGLTPEKLRAALNGNFCLTEEELTAIDEIVRSVWPATASDSGRRQAPKADSEAEEERKRTQARLIRRFYERAIGIPR